MRCLTHLQIFDCERTTSRSKGQSWDFAQICSDCERHIAKNYFLKRNRGRYPMIIKSE